MLALSNRVHHCARPHHRRCRPVLGGADQNEIGYVANFSSAARRRSRSRLAIDVVRHCPVRARRGGNAQSRRGTCRKRALHEGIAAGKRAKLHDFV